MTIDLSYFDRWIIAPYAICLFGSVLIGLAYIAVRLKHSGIKTEYTMYILFLELISILLCGNFLASVMQQKTPREAGFTSLGGAAGMLFGGWLNNVIFKEKRTEITETCVTALPLIYSIAKLGCLFGGCCVGLPYTGPFAVRYLRNGQIVQADSIPVQLIETVVFLLLFLAFLRCKNKIGAAQMIILCSVAKFLTDFLRDVHKDTVISPNQVGCVVVIVAAAFICVRKRRRRVA